MAAPKCITRDTELCESIVIVCESIAIVHRDWIAAAYKLLSFTTVILAVSPYCLALYYRWLKGLPLRPNTTVNRENFAVKINSRSRPTAKIKHAKNKLRSDTQWISLRASPHSPIDDYSEQSLVFLIPGSRLKATNSPSARPYCNRQPKNFADRTKPRKFINAKNFHANYF